MRFNNYLKRIHVHCIKLLESCGPCNELLVSAPGYIRPEDSDINCAFNIEFSNFVGMLLDANSVYWDIVTVSNSLDCIKIFDNKFI